MGEEVQLISDGDGLAVIGPEHAVEQFLMSADQWATSRALDLRRLARLLGVGSDVAQAASETAANSARWIKLTEESARLVQEHGLMPSQMEGQRHLMIGVPGRVRNWLQTDQDVRSLLTNPAVLSGVSGIMAQAAMRQAMAEITDYLARIDDKVDDVLRKVDDAAVSQMAGAQAAIERALKIREETGEVNETLWSTVDQTHQTIAATQEYALKQLAAVAAKLESPRVRNLARAAAKADREVPKWLAVLARCFQLQDAVDVIELDRVLAESPAKLAAYQRGLRQARQTRRDRVEKRIELLRHRMDEAVGTANAKMLWSRTSSLNVVGSANALTIAIDAFHRLLRIDSSPVSWEPRQLGRGADIGSQAIQAAKDKGPVAVQGLTLVVAAVVVVVGKMRQGSDGDDAAGDTNPP